MARSPRTSSNNTGPLRRQTQSTPNTNTEAETEKKEETQSEQKASEKENNANGSSDVSGEEEETTQRKNQALAEGKKPMEAKGGKHKKWEFNEMTCSPESTKGVVIGEGKRSKTITTPVKSGKRKVRYAVRSPCTLKSPLKKFYVDVASDDDEPKGKGKEKEADDFEDPEADSEETCKRIKKDRNGDDESDDNDGGGDGAGAHTNLSNLSLGEGLVAGNE